MLQRHRALAGMAMGMLLLTVAAPAAAGPGHAPLPGADGHSVEHWVVEFLLHVIDAFSPLSSPAPSEPPAQGVVL